MRNRRTKADDDACVQEKIIKDKRYVKPFSSWYRKIMSVFSESYNRRIYFATHTRYKYKIRQAQNFLIKTESTRILGAKVKINTWERDSCVEVLNGGWKIGMDKEHREYCDSVLRRSLIFRIISRLHGNHR